MVAGGLVGCARNPGDGPPGSIGGQVIDDFTKAAVNNAKIEAMETVVNDRSVGLGPSSPLNGRAAVSSDFSGQYVLSGLKPSWYYVTVTKSAYYPANFRLLVEADKTTAFNFNITPCAMCHPDAVPLETPAAHPENRQTSLDKNESP